MNCKRAKRELALCAGRDLDERAEQDLRRHLAGCPECRDRWQRMQNTVRALQCVCEENPCPDDVRLAPAVNDAIDRLELARQRPPRLLWSQVWVPAVAVAALILAAVSISQSLTRTSSDYEMISDLSGNRQPIISERQDNDRSNPSTVRNVVQPR